MAICKVTLLRLMKRKVAVLEGHIELTTIPVFREASYGLPKYFLSGIKPEQIPEYKKVSPLPLLSALRYLLVKSHPKY